MKYVEKRKHDNESYTQKMERYHKHLKTGADNRESEKQEKAKEQEKADDTRTLRDETPV